MAAPRSATTPDASVLWNPDATIAVYVHIPWCAALCPYCDFDKQASEFRLVDAYLDALIQHIQATPPRKAHSLFFGGGTPSLLTAPRLARIIAACRERFDLGPQAEVTIEANPSDIVTHKVAAYLEAGVNRISLGVQSLQDEELRMLGRRHSADKAVRAARAVREAGCANLSLDLMYGLPGQTLAVLERTLAGATALEPAHISCYALTLEHTTPMGAAAETGELALPDDDLVADQYARIQGTLAQAGFAQYELSNWAQPGRESIHNLTYWRYGEWLGLGAGAAGSFMGYRTKRTPIVRDYIAAAQAGEPGYVECEPWTHARLMRDTVMLGLRLAEGVSDAAFHARFGVGLGAFCTGRLPDLVRAGVLRWRGDRLALDPAQFFVCNAVLGEILPGDDE
jgi:oxygen-independent coproporphyrinogen-3 oxidase